MNTEIDTTVARKMHAEKSNTVARALDREVDLFLSVGRVSAAERISKLAAELREGSAQ